MKPSNILSNVLHVSGMQLQNLFLPGTSDVTGSRKNHKLFSPHLSSCTPGEPALCLFLRGFLASCRPGTPQYWQLHNIKYKNSSDVTDKNLGDPASAAVFWWCNAFWYMKAIQDCLFEQDSSEKSSFYVNIAQTEEFIASVVCNYQVDCTSTWKVVDFPFNYCLVNTQ